MLYLGTQLAVRVWTGI